MTRVAALGLYNEQGQIALQHRTADAPTYPNHWGCFGGHIEEGESPEAALAREALEELEYAVRRPVLVHTLIEPDIEKYYFAEAYDAAQPLVQHEGDDLQWFSEEELPALVPPTDRAGLARVFAYAAVRGQG